MAYQQNLLRSLFFSLASMLTALVIANIVLSHPMAQIEEINTAIFHILVVGPSEEIIFRFFLPLVIIYFTGTHYIVAGILAAIGFGFAHWWAYQQNLPLIMIAVSGGIIQTFTVWYFSRNEDDDGEWSMPVDAIAYYSISVVVFLFSMINYLYSSEIQSVLVYLIYAVTGIMAVVMGYFIMGFIREREEDGLDFSPGLLGAILAHGLYNVIVSSSPELIIPIVIFSWIAFGVAQYMKMRGDED